ncbi:hypothetical protein AAOE16_03045 [Ekhidna sp. MALMAid0563]|uniref:hypothetical protein n=1 Tax=Ekhidna sp. MALMAid0563 TaxID=3143937 RepID=UPI0032DE4C22
MKRNDKYEKICEVIPNDTLLKVEQLVTQNGGKRQNERFNNYLNICGRIYSHSLEKSFTGHVPTTFTKGYWRKVIGGKYLTYINELNEADVIQIIKYSTGYKYRLKGEDLISDNQLCDYRYRNRRSVNFIKEQQLSSIKKHLGTRVINSLNRVDFDFESFRNDTLITSNNHKIDLDQLPDTMKVKAEVHYPNDVRSHYYLIKTLKQAQKAHCLQSYRHKDKIILCNAENFEDDRRWYLMEHAELISMKVGKGSYNLSRDYDKTNRVFHNMVSLASVALPYVKIDEQPIVGLDIKTSQFALLANIFYHFHESGNSIADRFSSKGATFIKDLYKYYREECKNHDRDSISHFFNDVIEGDFYTSVRNKLNLNDRAYAKLVCFNILFSKDTHTNDFKIQLINSYPLIFNTTELYKNKKGYENLSINLQALEAEIVIDKMFTTVSSKKIPAFTRHDSLIVRSDHVDRTERIMKQIADNYQFKFKIMRENYDINHQTNKTQNQDIESDERVEEVIRTASNNNFDLNQYTNEELEELISIVDNYSSELNAINGVDSEDIIEQLKLNIEYYIEIGDDVNNQLNNIIEYFNEHVDIV